MKLPTELIKLDGRRSTEQRAAVSRSLRTTVAQRLGGIDDERSVPDSADIFQTLSLMEVRLVIDPAALQMVLGVLTGWLGRREREAVAYCLKSRSCGAGKDPPTDS